jgi:hypothetical protein
MPDRREVTQSLAAIIAAASRASVTAAALLQLISATKLSIEIKAPRRLQKV